LQHIVGIYHRTEDAGGNRRQAGPFCLEVSEIHDHIQLTYAASPM
jgi:hypothetical protein